VAKLVRDVCRHILPSCPTINVDLKRADVGFDDCQHPWGPKSPLIYTGFVDPNVTQITLRRERIDTP
jgi:hypothetical protein